MHAYFKCTTNNNSQNRHLYPRNIKSFLWGTQFARFLIRRLYSAKLSQDEAVDLKCEKCGHERALLSHKITKLPRVLVLHLKRFSVDPQLRSYVKTQHSVVINKRLDLGTRTMR